MMNRVTKLFSKFSKKIDDFLEKKTQELDEEKKQIDKEKLAQKYAKQFTDNQIQGFSVQILESKHILQNTKNLNTYKSRWIFFEEKVQKMSLLHGSYNYEDNIKIGVQEYKDLYPDRMVQKSFLTDIDNFDESAFFEKSFYKCVNHFIESEKTAIEKLKTPRAKENRLLKINDFVVDCLVFLHNRGYSKDDLFYAKIEEFRETI